MSEQYVLYEKTGQIARVTFNKPDKMNTFNFVGQGEDAQQLYAALKQAADDDDVKCVVLKGSGRAFGVGHDLTKVGFVYGFTTSATERRPSQRIRLRMDRAGLCDDFIKIFLHPKITIAQVHGYCLAGGALIAGMCDLVIAADDAKIGFPEQRLGFAGSGIPLVNVLIATVGLRRAVDLLLTGRQLTGKEAANIGFVTKSVAPETLEEEVNKMAEAICLLPRDGIAIGKAHRHLSYESLNLTAGFTHGYISHTLFTNLRWESDEYNFFKERRKEGAKSAFHGRDERFKDLV